MSEGIHLDHDHDNDDGQQDEDSRSPGHHFSTLYQFMQDLFEKLSILNYSTDFCTEYKCRPIHRYSKLSSNISLFSNKPHETIHDNDIPMLTRAIYPNIHSILSMSSQSHLCLLTLDDLLKGSYHCLVHGIQGINDHLTLPFFSRLMTYSQPTL